MVETAVEARALVSEEERRLIEQRVAEILKAIVGEQDLRHVSDKYRRTFPSDIALLRLIDLYGSAGEDEELDRAGRDLLTPFTLHHQATSDEALLPAHRQA